LIPSQGPLGYKRGGETHIKDCSGGQGGDSDLRVSESKFVSPLKKTWEDVNLIYTVIHDICMVEVCLEAVCHMPIVGGKHHIVVD
jgi:hypothetical protein